MTLYMVRIPYLEKSSIPNIEDLKIPGSKQIISQEAADDLNKKLRESRDRTLAGFL